MTHAATSLTSTGVVKGVEGIERHGAFDVTLGVLGPAPIVVDEGQQTVTVGVAW
jgi:hypothetical protein